jgi:hypothetical protein
MCLRSSLRWRRAAALPWRIVLLAIVVAGSSTPVAEAATRYVAPSGSDANPGTLAAPFRTVGRGIAALRPGDTTYVRNGTYVERVNLTMPSCTATARCWVKRYPGERPVIQGVAWLRGGSYWTIDGINVTWSSSNTSGEHMVKLVGGSSWEVRNSEFWGARSYAAVLVAGAPVNWRVTENCIHDTYPTNGVNQDHNVYANTGVTAGTGQIDHNILYNAVNGMNLKIGGPSAYGGSTGIWAHHNTMYNASQNVMVSWASHHNILERNITIASPTRNHRGYQLTGLGNVIRNTLGGRAPAFYWADPGYPGTISLSGNRTDIDPRFDSLRCEGFRPQALAAQQYGRYAY